MSRKGTCGLPFFSCSSLSSLLASLLLISLGTLIICISLLRPTYSTGKLSTQLIISLACHASSYPQACESSFRFIPLALHDDLPAGLVGITITLALQRVQFCHTLSQTLTMGSHDLNLASAARNCEYLLHRALYMLKKCSTICDASAHMIECGDAVGFIRIKDIEAWMSAALTWENDCFSALGYVNGTHFDTHGTHSHDLLYHARGSDHGLGSSSGGAANIADFVNHNLLHPNTDAMHTVNGAGRYGNHAAEAVSHLMHCVQNSITFTSNALSLLDAYDTYGVNVSAWRPLSKRTLPGYQGFGHKGPDKWLYYDNKGLVPTVTVSTAGHGMYTSIQEAVDNAPQNSSERYVIYIEEGLYNETVRIPYSKPFLALVGDGMGKTIITGNLNAQMPGVSTYDTATVAVDGDHFVAYNLTIENTAHPALHQAVALRVSSDRSAFYHCSILGHQDTLYAHSLRQFYQSCRIEGTMDFIFGNAASIFYNCELLIRPGRISSSIVTAHGRTDPAQTTGFVFESCIVNGTDEFMEGFVLNPKKYKVYLGRPWKMYSRTIYISSVMDRVVMPEGWRPWKGDFALKTLFYGEYNSTGKGANYTGRVKWAEQISSSLAMLYTVSNFIQGDEWLLGDVSKKNDATLK